MNIFRIIGLLKQIEEPPPLDKEAEVRDWARSTAGVMHEVAEYADDKDASMAADMFMTMCLEDSLWDSLYSLLQLARQHVED